jgi:hypothetical protein
MADIYQAATLLAHQIDGYDKWQSSSTSMIPERVAVMLLPIGSLMLHQKYTCV